MSEKLNYYSSLLQLSYDELVAKFLDKYGLSQDDYFKEKSYNRFLNNEIKTISKGKTSRTKEGLYCHHIDENKYLNINNQDFIKEMGIPFETQRKERLVYCDLIEHAILHAVISKETNKKFGYPGLSVFLSVEIGDWYINGYKPTISWQLNCYNTAFLSSEEAKSILYDIDVLVGDK